MASRLCCHNGRVHICDVQVSPYLPQKQNLPAARARYLITIVLPCVTLHAPSPSAARSPHTWTHWSLIAWYNSTQHGSLLVFTFYPYHFQTLQCVESRPNGAYTFANWCRAKGLKVLRAHWDVVFERTSFGWIAFLSVFHGVNCALELEPAQTSIYFIKPSEEK